MEQEEPLRWLEERAAKQARSYTFRTKRRAVWPWIVLVGVVLSASALSAFAGIGDDGYSFDSGCGTQGASCVYSGPYSLRFGHDDLWTFLGEKGPGDVVCPTSGDAASSCWYYGGGIAPDGPPRAPQGSAGPEPGTPNNPTDGPEPGIPGDGYQVGMACVRDVAEAAALACSQIGGVTAAGAVSCSGPSIAGGILTYSLRTTGSAVVAPVTVRQAIQGCEPQDLSTWSPAIAAWFLGLVTILGARNVYTKVFNRETI